MNSMHVILGVTRRQDDPKQPVSGLIYREGEKLKWGALAELFTPDAPPRFFRYVPTPKGLARQALERVEFTVSGTPRFLFKVDGKLVHEDLKEKLLFSEGKKSLLKPQGLAQPLALPTLVVEYLEVSRLSDVMRQEMLGGERSIGQLVEVLGLPATDKQLEEVLWELARWRFLTIHELGRTADNALGLNSPLPGWK